MGQSHVSAQAFQPLRKRGLCRARAWEQGGLRGRERARAKKASKGGDGVQSLFTPTRKPWGGSKRANLLGFRAGQTRATWFIPQPKMCSNRPIKMTARNGGKVPRGKGVPKGREKDLLKA